jgi:hypothetical protein
MTRATGRSVVCALLSNQALEHFAGLRTLLETGYEEDTGTARFRYFRKRGLR